VAPPYEIAVWAGFRTAAVSHTFDDGCSNQFAIAVPMFNAKGLKLTLFTVTSGGLFPGWDKLQDAASHGHEIASHTVTHQTLGSLPLDQQLMEETNSQNAINANISGQRCVTLAYPNCVLGNSAYTVRYYIGARTCSGEYIPKTPANIMAIGSFSPGSAQSFIDTANGALAQKAWCVFLTHGMDSDGGYAPIPHQALQGSVDYLSANLDKFWVETFGNVLRYIKERDNSAVTVLSTTSNSITLQVTNNLDNSIFNYPITLRRPLPAHWPAATVSQNNADVGAKIVALNSTNYVMFDIVPNGGDVTLSESGIVVVAPTQMLGTMQDEPVSMPDLKLLAGASDNTGYPLSVGAIAPTSTNGGSVSWSGGMVTYSPPAGFSGQDTFTYTLSDGNGGSAQGTVLVTITPLNAQTLNLISLQLTPTNCLLQFAGIPARSYIIQSAPTVAGPWTDLSGPIAADPTGLVQFLDTNPPAPIQFYRTIISGGNP
jgi:peptidoglycan-N-acetylglucosamine deacetylase